MVENNICWAQSGFLCHVIMCTFFEVWNQFCQKVVFPFLKRAQLRISIIKGSCIGILTKSTLWCQVQMIADERSRYQSISWFWAYIDILVIIDVRLSMLTLSVHLYSFNINKSKLSVTGNRTLVSRDLLNYWTGYSVCLSDLHWIDRQGYSPLYYHGLADNSWVNL